jgi:dihydrofolate synthase/folylpolyglutamate synthase
MQRMSHLVDNWHFCDLDMPRAAKASALAEQFEQLRASGSLKLLAPVALFQHPSPQAALAAAAAASDPADRILVFGSFYTVGGVLKDGVPRLQAGQPSKAE